MDYREKAKKLLGAFKGNTYVFGRDVLKQVGHICVKAGKSAVLVHAPFPGSETYVDIIQEALKASGVRLVCSIPGAAPNAPLEDLYRIKAILQENPSDVVLSFGGGSTIDAVKSALVLCALGGDIEAYFGTGNVSKALKEKGIGLTPHLAIQTVASSGAHLTKYSNITNIALGQKKLIVDDAIIPSLPLFDFTLTYGAPQSLTMDGALDGISHCLEVLYGSVNAPNYALIKEVAETGISLVVENLEKVISNPLDKDARDALCLATDLGAYAIMLGGTNGGHLTSFSLVDILSHGRACAMMNPYYTVFFAPAIEDALRMVGNIYKKAGFTKADLPSLKGRELGIAVAEAMLAQFRRIDFPVKLQDVAGFTEDHIERSLQAARNPQLRMKLQNMPIPMEPEQIDSYMRPILEAARDGDVRKVKNLI